MSRRPHRSFRRTRRRDYVRSLKLPGYFSFTGYVLATLRAHIKTFLLLALVYAVLTMLLTGISSQAGYSQVADVLSTTGKDFFQGFTGQIEQAGLLLVTIISGSAGGQLTEAQQIYLILLFLMTWLSTVWLLRAYLSGNKPRLRDAIYSSGSPIISTLLVSVLLVVQMLPASLAIIAYSTALSTNFLSTGVIALVFFVIALLLVTISVYLVISTFFALIVVTLPGMYPWQAVRTAGDLVVGRRIKILLRVVWMALAALIFLATVMLPTILLVNWIQGSLKVLTAVPLVPVILTFTVSLITIFIASYIYLLYRKVVDDESSPA